MIQLSAFCTCGDKHNHAAHCHTVKAAYMLAERYRALATQIREYALEQHGVAVGSVHASERYCGKRDAAREIADWLTTHADEVQRHAR